MKTPNLTTLQRCGRMFRATAVTTVAIYGLICSRNGDAQEIVYSNPTDAASGIIPGGAPITDTPAYTRLIADDIQVSPAAAGLTISGLSITLHNYGSSLVRVDLYFRFWAADGPGGGPGTFLFNYVDTFQLIPGRTATYTFFNPPFFNGSYGARPFVIPSDGRFWAGVQLGNQFGAPPYPTNGDLNKIGVEIAGAPSVGSSANLYFETTKAEDTLRVENPEGTLITNTVSGNFGWTFQAVPRLAVKAITHNSANAIHLQCSGVPDAVNRIEASGQLDPNSFATLASVQADSDGAFAYDDDVTGATAKFYRVAYP